MTRPLLILLMVCSGCGVSRTQYLRDRLQDSQDKQEQRKFNAEVLRKLEEMKELCFESKISSESVNGIYPKHIPWNFQNTLDEAEKETDREFKERPNYPCFRCGEEKK